MTLWWIADALLVLVVLPVVVYLLYGVLQAAQSIVPSVNEITRVLGRGLQGSRRRAAPADDARTRSRRPLPGSPTTAAHST